VNSNEAFLIPRKFSIVNFDTRITPPYVTIVAYRRTNDSNRCKEAVRVNRVDFCTGSIGSYELAFCGLGFKCFLDDWRR